MSCDLCFRMRTKRKLPLIFQQILSNCIDPTNGSCTVCGCKRASGHLFYTHVNQCYVRGLIFQRIRSCNDQSTLVQSAAGSIRKKYQLRLNGKELFSNGTFGAGLDKRQFDSSLRRPIFVCLPCKFGTNRLQELKQHLADGHSRTSESTESLESVPSSRAEIVEFKGI